jgi:glutamate synthase domain-containing protein 2
MFRNPLKVSAKGFILMALIVINILVLVAAIYANYHWLWALSITLSSGIFYLNNVFQKKHTLLRNYPLLGYFRYLFESIRPEMRQYFWESDTDGRPFNRRQRSIVYQRSKNVRQTVAFGMQADAQLPGHEWVAHSIFPVHLKQEDMRVTIGNNQCLQPYSASILNIGAMSYGALSKTAIRSLNEGAALGGFAHNTGEGGISEYHLSGGDLIWQIGTGYFGCRDQAGKFDPALFKKNAAGKSIKMIELKLSQGAKPGHGGILPAQKNTAEIAKIRNVAQGTTVYSPPAHSAFSNPIELILFVGQLRDLSEGKPVGLKLCIGDKQQFVDICNAINVTRIIPDFITIDGSEGGTGAAPLEFTDNMGMPLHEALAFATDTLELFQLRKEIKLIAAGKIITAFDILKAISLGASACYSARGMMFSLGCIQALKCDSGKCPVGIATQNPSLYKGLDSSDKSVRVYNFHKNTIAATREMMEACGFRSLADVHPSKFFRKMESLKTKSFSELYFPDAQDKFKQDRSNISLLN